MNLKMWRGCRRATSRCFYAPCTQKVLPLTRLILSAASPMHLSGIPEAFF